MELIICLALPLLLLILIGSIGLQRPDPTKCPKCGSRTIRRTAKRGKHAGLDFHGCSRWPRCDGTVAGSGQDLLLRLKRGFIIVAFVGCVCAAIGKVWGWLEAWLTG